MGGATTKTEGDGVEWTRAREERRRATMMLLLLSLAAASFGSRRQTGSRQREATGDCEDEVDQWLLWLVGWVDGEKWLALVGGSGKIAM